MSDNSLPADAVPLAVDGVPVAQTVPVAPGARPAYVPPGELEVKLPDGRTITMAEPQKSLSKAIAQILEEVAFKDTTMMQMERQRVRALLYISHVNGRPVGPVMDQIGRFALEQEIGDRWLDDLFMKWGEHFLNDIKLETVKKF